MYILGGEEKYEYLDSHTYYCSYRCDCSWYLRDPEPACRTAEGIFGRAAGTLEGNGV